ncbi:MAG TPA: hypothetical protein VIJ96_17735 [Acidothermaceae bacterium]
MGTLTDRVAIVTGSDSRIGQACAIGIARDGAIDDPKVLKEQTAGIPMRRALSPPKSGDSPSSWPLTTPPT